MPSGFKEVLAQSGLYPQEALLWAKPNARSLRIGLPKEASAQEHRISLTPEAVALLIANGHEVLIETDAGLHAKFSDGAYINAGASVSPTAEEVFGTDVILKIGPPNEQEISYLSQGATLISTLNVPNLDKSYFEKLNQKRITGLAWEYIEDNGGGLPVIRAMSEIAGSSVIPIAAECLSQSDGQSVLLGGITGLSPTRVIILGAGTVAEFATRTALSFGASVQIFDKDMYKLQRIRYAVGQSVSTAIIDSQVLPEAIRTADVVIGALRAEDGFTPCIVTEEMVSAMKPNAVVIDVCIDQGGCFETSETTTHQRPTFKKYGVIHYCVPNIPSRVAHTASSALSNVFAPFLLKTGKTGGIEEMIFGNKAFMKGVYCYNGSLTNAHIAKKMGLTYKDLSLLMAARL